MRTAGRKRNVKRGNVKRHNNIKFRSRPVFHCLDFSALLWQNVFPRTRISFSIRDGFRLRHVQLFPVTWFSGNNIKCHHLCLGNRLRYFQTFFIFHDHTRNRHVIFVIYAAQHCPARVCPAANPLTGKPVWCGGCWVSMSF